MGSDNCLIDFHCHCLAHMDDGAANTEVSSAMLLELKKQGANTVVATPHFFPLKESVSDFLERRKRSFNFLVNHPQAHCFPRMLAGAEVHLVPELSKLELNRLCIGTTNAMLIEMPYESNKPWMIQEIENISSKYNVIPILAHIDRYEKYYGPNDYQRLFSIGRAVFQINVSAFKSRKLRRNMIGWDDDGHQLLFGTDAHNMGARSPQFDFLMKWLDKPKYQGLLKNMLQTTNEILQS